jgi:hypothetical protein
MAQSATELSDKAKKMQQAVLLEVVQDTDQQEHCVTLLLHLLLLLLLLHLVTAGAEATAATSTSAAAAAAAITRGCWCYSC